MPRPESTPCDGSFDWELEVTDSVLLLSLAYVFPSVFGGILILAGGLLVWLVLEALLTGNLVRVVTLIGIALLGFVSRRYLPALLATEFNLINPLRERYSRRGLLIGSIPGAIVILGSTRLHPVAPFAVFVASWIPLVLTAGFPTTGQTDSEARTLVVDGTEVPLEAVRGFRTISMQSFVLCWLSYPRGTPSAPRVIVLPPEIVESIEAMVDSVPVSSDREQSTIDWPERLVAGLFGLGMTGTGPVLWLALPPGDGRLIALYAGAMFGLFGVVLLWYAYSA